MNNEEELSNLLARDICERVKEFLERKKVEEKDLSDANNFKETCKMLASLNGNAQRELIER